MRILHVTRELQGDRRYGLGKSLQPVIDAMVAQGHTVRYLCQEDLTPAELQQRARWQGRLQKLPGVQGRPYREMMIGAWAERLQMGLLAARLAATENWSHVHLHDPWIACGFRLGCRRHRLNAVRWGVTEHGFGSYSRATHDDGLLQGPGMQRLLRRIEASTLAAADWVVAPTALALAALARDLAQPEIPAHWQVVPHARPAFPPVERSAMRRQLGWDEQRQVVIAVGRIVPLKHFDAILRCCAALAGEFPQLHLQILGDGPQEALLAQARTLGFADRLSVAVTDRIGDYLQAADLYVSMSSTESFGLANLEALHAGLPAICSAVGGVPEVVGDGGWLIPRDEDCLLRSLRQLLATPADRAAWQDRARARTAAWPDHQEICDAYLAIYRG